MNSKIFNVFIFIVLVSFIIESIDSECCYSRWGYNGRYCADGTRLKGHYCGIGSCNLFGCNCEGGCRKFKTLNSSRADFYTIKGEKCITQCEYYNNAGPFLHNTDDPIERKFTYYWCKTSHLFTSDWDYCSPRKDHDYYGVPCKGQCQDNSCSMGPSNDPGSCGRVDDKCLTEYKTDLIKALNFTETRTKRSSNFWDYHDRGSANINNNFHYHGRGSTNNNYLNYPDQDFNDLWRRVLGQHTITIYSPNNINNPILNVYYTGSDTRSSFLGIHTGSDTRIIRAVSANITIRHIGGRYRPFGNSLDDRMRVMHAWGYGNNNQPTDERGHIIASQLGGLNEWYNLIPMSPSLNRNYANYRGWVNEENFIRRFFENCPSSIFMRVVLAYDDNSNRPYGLRLNWAAIDDETHFSLPFDYFFRQ